MRHWLPCCLTPQSLGAYASIANTIISGLIEFMIGATSEPERRVWQCKGFWKLGYDK